jgi:putative Flp pilus-assembly TadE/G-like protein
MLSGLCHRFVQEESGAIAIIVAIMFPVFLLFGVLAVDVSHWNVNKRQLQTQADAAALAGAAQFQFPCNATVEANVLNAAKQYAGDAAFGAGRVNTFNDLGDANHHVLYNSTTYFGGRTKPDAGAPTLTGHPCTDNAIDVKVTQSNVGALFDNSFLAKNIDATARAELKTANGVYSLSPIGVPLPSPTHVYAQFVNESSGNPYSLTGSGVVVGDANTFRLDKVTGTSNPTLWQSGTVTPQGVQPGDKIGIRAVLDANSNPTVPVDCNATGLECDSSEGNTWATLMSLRQWPQTSPDAAAHFVPYVTALRLDHGACTDTYFDDVPTTPAAGCNMTINATVKFNPTATNIAGKESVKATVHLPSGDQTVSLNYLGSDNWQAASALPVTPNSGRSPITLNIEQTEGDVHGTSTASCKNGNQNPALCKVTIDDAQRVYAANYLNSGYIQNMEVDQPGVQSFANSLSACTTAPCSYGLTLTIGVATLHIAVPGERPVTLRILKDTTGNASKNGSLNCDTAASTNLQTELTVGCNVAYRTAVGNECDSVTKFGDMAANPPNPYPCVQEKPGENKQAVGKAMQDRILGGGNNCNGAQDNQWDAGSPGDLPLSDPRRYPVFLTDFGVFTGSGRAFVPVRGFGEFYITGWSGQEKGNGTSICSKNDPVPGDADGYLVGHFIKDVAPPGVGDNGQACDPTALDLCTAVLTR